MSEKENDEFSNAVLLATVAIYVAITAALFAGMVAKHRDVALGLADWARDYGSLIAGVPVLIAVWVAKQQLEASRAQTEVNRAHQSASVKLAFKDELESIHIAEEIANEYISVSIFGTIGLRRPRKITGADMITISKSKSPHLIDAFKILYSVVNEGGRYLVHPRDMDIREMLSVGTSSDTSRAAKALSRAVNDRKNYLRQFMPDLK